jgi:UDP-glucose 4-epimerase
MENKITSLVTGGAGFIGAHVVNHLIEMGHNVVVLDDLSGGFEENINTDAIFVKGCITDVDLIIDIFEKYQFDYVYHLAAYAAEALSHFIRKYNYDNNLTGSINLINASIKHNIKCFVFTSSIGVYGHQEPPMVESNQPTPIDPYGIAKYAVEMDLASANDMFGLDYIIFRPHNVYGRYQNIGDKYRNVIGIFMNQILKGEDLTIFGDGEQTRAFSHIDDVAPHIANSINYPEAYGEIINIGGDVTYTVNNLADVVIKSMDMGTSNKIHLEARNEVDHAFSDHQKAHSLFNIDSNSMVDLGDGISDMAEWVKNVGSKHTPDFTNIEIHKKLPQSWNK